MYDFESDICMGGHQSDFSMSLLEALRNNTNINLAHLNGLAEDLMRFLSLYNGNGELSKKERKLIIAPPNIKEAWKIFLMLDTEKYEKYCLEKFGRFLHFQSFFFINKTHKSLYAETIREMQNFTTKLAKEKFGELSLHWTFVDPIEETQVRYEESPSIGNYWK